MKCSFNDKWIYRLQGQGEATEVTLPHDAMIDSPRRKDAAGGGACAYFDGGVYEYEKTFDVPAQWSEKNVWLEFGGVYRNPKVYINGKLAGEWAYGYSQFNVSLDSFLEYGKENTVRVVADNSKLPNSRWYTGGGIYRPVHLIVKDKLHFELGGVTVETVSYSPAVIKVSAKKTGGNVIYKVFDGEKHIAVFEGSDGTIEIPDAKLWSDESPNLYTLSASLYDNGKIVDEETITFGIRKIEWNNKGLFINGKETLLRGGCVHHDNGILGARCYDEAEERKVRIIKEAGYNAVRFSHNPCSGAFASACDKYGLYLIDEFSDMWYARKKKYDYALDFPTWYKKDLEAMVSKDKNHPSVIMYSLGNEVTEPREQKGVDLVKEMVSLLHGLDATRPVTAGINFYIVVNAGTEKSAYTEDKIDAEAAPGTEEEKPTSSVLFNMIATRMGPAMNQMGNSDKSDSIVSPCLDALDIAGYNYASGRYPLEGSKHPNRVIYGSETFPQDIYKNWQMVKEFPYLVGDFMWTAWDYLGEVGAGGWSYEPQFGMKFEKPYPWIIADAGAIDLLGNIGAEAKFAATTWGLEKQPYIGVRPVNKDAKKLVKSVWRGTNAIASWSWQGCEGKKAEIEVYSDAAYIELHLNGEKLGTKKVKECKAVFKTKYAAGTLKAVALDKKKQELSSAVLKSAEKDLQIGLYPESKIVKPSEVVFVNVTLCDGGGIVESNADCRLNIEVENGELLAFGSAQQKTGEKYSSNVCDTYYGRALAVVKAKNSEAVKIIVRSNQYEPATVTIPIK